jgi:hypothetical protein
MYWAGWVLETTPAAHKHGAFESCNQAPCTVVQGARGRLLQQQGPGIVAILLPVASVGSDWVVLVICSSHTPQPNAKPHAIAMREAMPASLPSHS